MIKIKNLTQTNGGAIATLDDGRQINYKFDRNMELEIHGDITAQEHFTLENEFWFSGGLEIEEAVINQRKNG